jgi:excinuclease ABC subunit A
MNLLSTDLSHTITLVEHHPDVIKCADHVIDLGPEGGKGRRERGL